MQSIASTISSAVLLAPSLTPASLRCLERPGLDNQQVQIAAFYRIFAPLHDCELKLLKRIPLIISDASRLTTGILRQDPFHESVHLLSSSRRYVPAHCGQALLNIIESVSFTSTSCRSPYTVLFCHLVRSRKCLADTRVAYDMYYPIVYLTSHLPRSLTKSAFGLKHLILKHRYR